MKKTYLSPNIVVVKLSSMHLLSASNETIYTKGNYGDGSGITLGGRSSDFDDEE